MTGLPDPRPRLADGPPTTAGARVAGFRCTACRHPLALDAPWCPRCRGALEPAAFGPAGTVWSATVLRVPLPGRTPPNALAYVDLDDGPRVLGHVRGACDVRLRCGTRVGTAGLSSDGDLLFEPLEVDE